MPYCLMIRNVKLMINLVMLEWTPVCKAVEGLVVLVSGM